MTFERFLIYLFSVILMSPCSLSVISTPMQLYTRFRSSYTLSFTISLCTSFVLVFWFIVSSAAGRFSCCSEIKLFWLFSLLFFSWSLSPVLSLFSWLAISSWSGLMRSIWAGFVGSWSIWSMKRFYFKILLYLY